MIAKRFTIKPSIIVDDVTVIIDNQKEYTFPVLDSTLNYMFCKVLNELYDENEQLKKDNQQLIACREFCNSLEKENEQLKNDASVLIHSNKDYRIENEQLKQENKELKSTIKEHRKYIEEIHEEKEQLKQELNECEKIRHHIFKKINELQSDNK